MHKSILTILAAALPHGFLLLASGCAADASGDPRSEPVASVSLEDSVVGWPYVLDFHGGTGGNTWTNLSCGLNGVAVGIYGATTQSWGGAPYDFIQQFGFICQRFDSQTGNLGVAFPIVPGGPDGPYKYRAQCPAGQVMVGLYG